MLITIKNNGKGAQGVWANGSKKPVFIPARGSKRVTVTEEELARIVRIKTLAVIKHDSEDSADAGEPGSVVPTVETEHADPVPDDGDKVEHPVLDEGDDDDEGEPAPVVDSGDKPWEKTSGRKRK